MTSEEQRIAIAEACGWSNVEVSGFRNQQFVGTDKNGDRSYIPDYLNDLNAMHEAEKVLTTEQHIKFIDTLLTVTSGLKSWGDSGHEDIWDMCHASATQRAEAFLRAIGVLKTK